MPLQTPNEFILSHAAQRIYDPVKAHQYYLRTRKLKGRRKGVAPAPKLTGDLAIEKTNTIVKDGKVIPDPNVPLPKMTITARRQAEVQARVKELRGKLEVLHTILNTLLKDATGGTTHTRAKRATKSVATKSRSAVTQKDRKALTGAQKQEKAKKARAKYQKEHPQSQRTQKAQDKKQKIAEVKQKIEEVKRELTAALERARQLSTQHQPAK